MANKPKDEPGAASKGGAEAVDYVQTKQEVDAAEQRRAADELAAKATRSKTSERGSHDSPKPHGDKLEQSVKTAAGERDKR
jgi:hypothetical protein